MGKQWKQWLTLYFWAPKSLQMVVAAMKLKDAYEIIGTDFVAVEGRQPWHLGRKRGREGE